MNATDSRRWTLVVVIVGIALRLRVYLFNRSLWLDELFLVSNFADRGFADWLLPLDHGQVAAPGFFLLTRVVTSIVGSTELAFRLLPIIAAIAGLILLRSILHRYVSPVAALISVIVIALSPYAIELSAEFKPYSIDLLVTLLVARHALRRIVDGDRRGDSLRLVGLGWMGLLTSLPSPFVLAAAAIALLVDDPKRIRTLAPVGIGWGILGVVIYSMSLAGHHHDEHLYRYWIAHHGFPDVRDSSQSMLSHSLDWILWLGRSLPHAFENPVGFSLMRWTVPLAYLALAIFLRGMVLLFRRDRSMACFVGATILLPLAAAAVRLYPFAGRLLLFAAPMFAIPIGVGLDDLFRRHSRRRWMMGLVLFLLFITQSSIAMVRLIAPKEAEETRPIITEVARRRVESEPILVYWWTRHAWWYYAPRVGLAVDDATILPFIYPRDVDRYRTEVARSRAAGVPRAWLIVSHFYPKEDERLLLLDNLESAGAEILDSRVAPSAAWYLLDLRGLRPE